MKKILLRRGLLSNLPTLDVGEAGFVTDTGQLYIGGYENYGAENQQRVNILINTISGSSGLTEQQLDDAIEAALAGYATESYVNDQINMIPPPNLTGYATETYVNDAIGDIESPVSVDSNDNITLTTEDTFIDDNEEEVTVTKQWEFASDGTTYLSKNSFESTTYLSTPLNETDVSLEITAGRDIYLKTAGYDSEGGVSTSIAFKFDDEGAITFPDNTVQNTAFNFDGYDNEIHVSGVDGNDTTGNGDILNPVASITKALTLITGGRRTIVVHPGSYTEDITTSVTNTTIATTELTGANTVLFGTLMIGAAARISGLRMSNLTISSDGNAYISNCTVDTQLIKSGSGYTEIINSELQCTSGCQFTGAGQVFINGNKIFSPSVSNANASVTIRGANQVVTPSVTAGNLAIENSVVVSASPDSNAITTSASTNLVLANSFVLNSTGTSVERIALSGFYSILNVVYDKPNSTLVSLSGTGGSTSSIDYFQHINADRLILAPNGQITFPNNTVQTSANILWSISASGSSDYVFSGPGIVSGNTDNPVLYLYRGFTYTFVNTTGANHPFAIRVSNGGANYTPGVSGTQTGTQTFTVPMDAPSTLYYQCTIHSAMGNAINIV
jgi:hypothetical protein